MSWNSIVSSTTSDEPDRLGDPLQPLVRNRDDGDVGVDRGERVVAGLGPSAGERVEQGGLARVGEPDDADLHPRGLGRRRGLRRTLVHEVGHTLLERALADAGNQAADRGCRAPRRRGRRTGSACRGRGARRRWRRRARRAGRLVRGSTRPSAVGRRERGGGMGRWERELRGRAGERRVVLDQRALAADHDLDRVVDDDRARAGGGTEQPAATPSGIGCGPGEAHGHPDCRVLAHQAESLEHGLGGWVMRSLGAQEAEHRLVGRTESAEQARAPRGRAPGAQPSGKQAALALGGPKRGRHAARIRKGLGAPGSSELAAEHPHRGLRGPRARPAAVPAFRLDLVGALEVALVLLGQRPANRSSHTQSVTSSWSWNERLSKFTVPTDDHAPSTTIVLAWSIVGWYSKMRAPASSSWA